MRIYGKTAKNPDLNEFITLLQAGPTPFDIGEPSEIKTGYAAQQGQMGYSATDPIGTNHVGQCVAVIARDPKTCATGIAHVDDQAHPASIVQMLESLSKDPLDIILFGARYGEQSNAHPNIKSGAVRNLTKVLKVLKGRNDKIIAAQTNDILDMSETAGDENAWKTRIFIDPVTGGISHRNAEHPDPNEDWTFVKRILTGTPDSIQMDTGFDLRKSPDRNPILLRKVDVSILNSNINNKSKEAVAHWFVHERQMNPERNWVDQCAGMAMAWNGMYQTALAQTAKAIGRDIATMRVETLYVGQGALQANIARHGKEKPVAFQRPASKL